jgi:hypothetical protein
MELLLIPLTLVLGSALIFFGVNGLPEGLQLSRSGAPSLIHLRHEPVERRGGGSVLPRLQPRPPVPETDLLLADLMTEMIAIRAEMAELRDKFEAAVTAPRPAATRARKVAKAS